ncbi:hypothetical protein [Marinicrinis lubricantis]|uniref:Uncharacterized protein n=1 Tax=Marinicrinis lubricantis TaxID=2086470 RepID=A0ABW1ITI5_9BACL
MTEMQWIWNKMPMPLSQNNAESTNYDSFIILLAIVLTFAITLIWAKRKSKRKNGTRDSKDT